MLLTLPQTSTPLAHLSNRRSASHGPTPPEPPQYVETFEDPEDLSDRPAFLLVAAEEVEEGPVTRARGMARAAVVKSPEIQTPINTKFPRII